MRRGRLLIGYSALLVLFSACSLLMLIRSTVFRSERRPLPKEGLDEGRGSTSTSDDVFVDFSFSSELDQYPWQHLHYGRWRRRLIVPGAIEPDQPIAAGPEATELERVLRRAADRLKIAAGDPGYHPSDCVGGRFRLLPGVGVQYEVYFRDRAAAAAAAAANASVASMVKFHVVRLQRPLEPLQVKYGGRMGSRLVHIVLPYYNRPAALEAFLARFTKLAQSLEPVALTVVRFSEGLPALDDVEERQDQSSVLTMVAAAQQALGANVPRVRLLEAAGQFSVGAGWLEAAAMTSSQDDLLMLSHVDLLFGRKFLQRCRANSHPGEMAYYPVVFSTFNPNIAYGVIKKKVVSVQQNYEKNQLINEDLGYWLDTDYGVSCQYLSDFRRFSSPFGNEVGADLDVMLYERFVKSGMEVVRMPDPDLVQVYRKVTCMREMGREVFNTCLKTKAKNEASKLEWGLWVYKNMGDTDEVEKFLDIVKTFGDQMPRGI